MTKGNKLFPGLLAMLCGMTILSTGPFANCECLVYEEYISSIFMMDTEGHCRDIECRGDCAFVAHGDQGLLVVEASDPFHCNPIAAVTSHYSIALCLQGDYAYMACGLEGIRVIDVSLPTAPAPIGLFDTPDFAYDIAVSGETAYVADRNTGLMILDMGNRTTPIKLLDQLLPAEAYCLALHGDLLFVGGLEPGLAVYEIGRPEWPVLVSTLDLPDVALGMQVYEQTLYIASATTGLLVVDITNPAVCEIVRTYNTSGYAYNVMLLEQRVFIADMDNGVEVYDMVTPSDLIHAGHIDTEQAYALAAIGDHVVVADGMFGLQAILAPESQFAYPLFTDTDPYIENVACRGNLVCTSNYSNEIRFFRTLEDGSLSRWSTLSFLGRAWATAFAGDHLVIADKVMGLHMVDISDPGYPTLLGTTPIMANNRDVAVRGDHAFLATYGLGLQVVDISDPMNPRPVNNLQLYEDVHSIRIKDTYAFLAAESRGVVVVDIGNPASPGVAAWLNTPSAARDVALAGDIGCVATAEDGMLVFDTSSPENPVILGGLPTQTSALSVTMTIDTAYLVIEDKGLLIVDITDPSSPNVISRIQTITTALNVVLGDDFIFTTSGYYGIATLARQCGDQITNVTAPRPYSPYALDLFPNPCNPGTTAAFDIEVGQHISLSVYDARGQEVDVLHDGWLDAGRHSVYWNGRSSNIRGLASGVFFVRIEGEAGVSTEKLILLK